MPVYKKKPDLLETQEGREFRQTLQAMVVSNAYRTEPSFSANIKLYPDHLIPFVDKHVDYLRSHPAMDPQHYLSNLRLMTLIR